jgi:hypothetical protein
MNISIYLAAAVSLTLLGVLLWSLRRATPGADRATLQEPQRHNLEYFAQIQQALSSEDRQFLLARGNARLAGEVERERRAVVLHFLAALQQEFEELIRLGIVIASLSPEVESMQEFERFRLNVLFHFRLLAIRTRLSFGMRALPEIGVISALVSGLAVRMETAMKDLGERAALAVELASAADGSDEDFA